MKMWEKKQAKGWDEQAKVPAFVGFTRKNRFCGKPSRQKGGMSTLKRGILLVVVMIAIFW
jgi:hypothetical protein